MVGGPCEYSGETMKVSHEGMGVTHADFNALVEHLIIAMEAQYSVSTQTSYWQNSLCTEVLWSNKKPLRERL